MKGFHKELFPGEYAFYNMNVFTHFTKMSNVVFFVFLTEYGFYLFDKLGRTLKEAYN